MRKHFHSLHKFKDKESIQFSAKEYSRLKYGSIKFGRKFGESLAKSLFEELLTSNKYLLESEIVVCSAPYKYLPVAATTISNFFTPRFNELRINLGKEVKSAQNLKVSRGHSYNVDYGALGVKERERRLSTDNYHIDKEALIGKTVIFIDDVKITGSHERRMENLLKSCGFDGDVIFCYYAEFTGEGHPSIENYLNYNDLDDGLQSIQDIIIRDKVLLNTRLSKFIMSYDSVLLEEFFRFMSQEFLYDLYTGMIGNDYHNQEEFKGNMMLLNSFLQDG